MLKPRLPPPRRLLLLPRPPRPQCRLATLTSRLPSTYFDHPPRPPLLYSSPPPSSPRKPSDRDLQLGETLRILKEHMPTLLQHPLPSSILSPHISLHVFPSTHPHLPAIRGRVPYTAALWTAGVWGRLPRLGRGLGGVEIVVESERMCGQMLVVRWRTNSSGPTNGNGPNQASASAWEAIGPRKGGDDEFHGIFYFDFDEMGRIVKHTIENADRDSGELGSFRVATMADWLIGAAKRGTGGAQGAQGGLVGCEKDVLWVDGKCLRVEREDVRPRTRGGI